MRRNGPFRKCVRSQRCMIPRKSLSRHVRRPSQSGRDGRRAQPQASQSGRNGRRAQPQAMLTRSHLALAAAAGAIGIALALRSIRRCRRRWPHSSYLSQAAEDPTLTANRKKMIELYLHDVAHKDVCSPPPKPAMRGAIRFTACISG